MGTDPGGGGEGAFQGIPPSPPPPPPPPLEKIIFPNKWLDPSEEPATGSPPPSLDLPLLLKLLLLHYTLTKHDYLQDV